MIIMTQQNYIRNSSIWKYNGKTNWSQQVIFKKDTKLGGREIGYIQEKVEKGVTVKCDQKYIV